MCSQNICPRGCKVTLVAFIWLFSTVFYQMCPQTVCPRGCIVTLVAFVWLFSIVCVSNVSSNYLPERMHSHIGCICLAFLHCAFSNVSLNCIYQKWQCHTGCICLTCQFFAEGFSNLQSSNQRYNLQESFPLPMFLVLCPNGYFKLRQIYDWMMKSISFSKQAFTFSYGKCPKKEGRQMFQKIDRCLVL